MPEEIEVPTEHLHEKMEEEAHHASGERAWISKVAVSSAILAVAAAITALLASHHSDEAILEAMEALRAGHATSLSAPRAAEEDADNTLEASIGTQEDGFDRAEERAVLAQLAHCLTDREREVLSLRFEHDMTQEEIGQRVGVSQMQISRILRGALAKLSAEAKSA